MDRITKNPNSHNPVTNRIEALKTLAKLLLHEVETLEEISPPANDQMKENDIDFSQRIQRYEVDLICNALRAVNGNQRKAAKILGIKNSTLNAKIKRYDIGFWSVTEKSSTVI